MKQAEYLREEEVILALRSALGNKGMAAENLGLSRGQLQDYIVNHPAVRDELVQIKESVIDEAEEQLFVRMKESDSLLIFFLRTQGRGRGYEPSLPVTGPDGQALNVNVDARSLISAMRQGFELNDELESAPKEIPDNSPNGS